MFPDAVWLVIVFEAAVTEDKPEGMDAQPCAGGSDEGAGY